MEFMKKVVEIDRKKATPEKRNVCAVTLHVMYLFLEQYHAHYR